MRRVFDEPPGVGGPPPGTLFLMAATTAVVITGAFLPVQSLFLFLPEAVLRGAVWQFLTATVTPMTPFGWLIGLLVLYLFGNVIERMLGTGRFLTLCFAGGAAAYLGTLLTALGVRLLLPTPPSFVFAASSATLFSLMVGVFAARLWHTPTFFNFVQLRGRTIFYVSAAIDGVFLLYGYPDSVSALWALGVGFFTVRGADFAQFRAARDWVTGPFRRWRIRRKYKNFRLVESEMQRMWDELEERMNREDRRPRR